MRIKTIISIIAFVTAFGVSVFLSPPKAARNNFYRPNAPCRHQTSSIISDFLEKDVANGSVRDRNVGESFESENFSYTPVYNINYLAAVSHYTEISGQLNTNGLPEDFVAAWEKHLNAWQNYSEFLNENIDSNGKILRERKFAAHSQYYNRQISETWSEVVEIARENGAVIPKEAF